ncbi:MAG: YARHG domain-containing protein [Sphingobacteriales bacterium]|nr:YARHG domain-containing protein [Sphingobacteriales bacterium]
MKKLFLLVLISAWQPLLANDGVFYAMGNTLIPLKETTVQLKKEVLSLERRGDWMQVDIYFEFFNPGPEKELTVGFVTPPAMGDFPEEEVGHPQIKDFLVMAGNQILPFKIAQMKETGFKVSGKLANGQDFVYHFTVRFAKGITIIRHSYLYRGGATVDTKNDFFYRLTTGTSWANGAIGDFELNISMGDDGYFGVPAGFGETPVNWTIVGIGQISPVLVHNPYDEEGGGSRLRMTLIRKGKLQLRQTQFRPQKDLALTIFQPHSEAGLWCDKKGTNDFANYPELLWGDSVEAVVHALSGQQLRLYRNLNVARAGYAFKDESLRKAFSKYNWYLPDPAIKPENAPDYYVSKELMRLIIAEENSRKQKTGTE